jgi:thiamine-monophosphate kinase
VGAAIDEAALPIDPGARAWFDSRRADSTLESVTGGDDYELVFATRPRLRGRLKAAARHGDAPITRIGVCTENPAVVLLRTVEGAVVETPMPRGYRHFR